MINKTDKNPTNGRAGGVRWALGLVIGMLGWIGAVQAELVIGTGGETGVYYPTGKAVCAAVNKQAKSPEQRCTAVPSGGSVVNAQNVRSGKYTFGIVQSDVQFYAIKGYGPFKGKGEDQKLRSVVSFFPETFTIVARADSGIRKLDDLTGKRVNIGNPGSGHRTIMDLLMHMKGWSKKDFAEAQELPSTKQSMALCDGKIDAFVFMAGHPNASIKSTVEECPSVVVGAQDGAVKKLVQSYPYFAPVVIPGDTYKGTGWSTPSFGVMATLVTSANTPDEVVYDVVRSIFLDFTDFKFSHPAFFDLKPKDMVTKGLTAPVHPGALRYYKQMGFEPKVNKVQPPRR